jgi:outer membrane lipoprotein-sorting protein
MSGSASKKIDVGRLTVFNDEKHRTLDMKLKNDIGIKEVKKAARLSGYFSLYAVFEGDDITNMVFKTPLDRDNTLLSMMDILLKIDNRLTFEIKVDNNTKTILTVLHNAKTKSRRKKASPKRLHF